MKLVVIEYPRLTRFGTESVRSDKDVMLQVLQKDAIQWRYLPNNIKTDVDILLVTIETYPDALYETDPSVRDNYDIALALLERKMNIYRHLSDRLRSDKKLFGLPYQLDVTNFLHIGEEIGDDKDIVMNCLHNYGDNDKFVRWFYLSISDCLKEDEDIIRLVLQINPGLMDIMPYEIQASKDFVLLAFNANKEKEKKVQCYHSIASELREDKNIVLEAIRCSSVSPQSLTKQLRRDPDIIELLLYTD